MQQTRTLIDTLSDGYRTVNRRPLLALLPVALNLYLWFGAQISFAPLIDTTVGLLERMQPADQPADPSALESMRSLGQIDMRYTLAVLNALPELPTAWLIGLAGSSEPIQVGSLAGAALTFVLVNGLALGLSALFLTWLAQVLRGEATAPLATLRHAGRAALSMLGTAGIFAVVGIALLLPFIVFSIILMALSQSLGLFMMSLIVPLVFWAWIYLGFANEAITVGGLGPLHAIQVSFTIVRRHFWGTVGLLLLAFVIWNGFAALWNSLTGSIIGVALAIVGSAYIGCGLQAARMIFIQDRLPRWQAAERPLGRGERTL
jgi:hypothetical protein